MCLFVAVVTYLTMFHKFLKNKTKLRVMKKLLEEVTAISFQRIICNFRKDLTKSQIPEEMDTQIQILQITNITSNGSSDFKTSLKRQRRRSSSVLRSLVTLTSHVRAAKYILLLVLTLVVTWTPWFFYVIIEFAIHYSDEQKYLLDLNNTMILECVNNVFKEKECSLSVPLQYLEDIKKRIRLIVHLDEANSMTIVLSVFLSSLNSLANPILYALWYPDFREHYTGRSDFGIRYVKKGVFRHPGSFAFF